MLPSTTFFIHVLKWFKNSGVETSSPIFQVSMIWPSVVWYFSFTRVISNTEPLSPPSRHNYWQEDDLVSRAAPAINKIIEGRRVPREKTNWAGRKELKSRSAGICGVGLLEGGQGGSAFHPNPCLRRFTGMPSRTSRY